MNTCVKLMLITAVVLPIVAIIVAINAFVSGYTMYGIVTVAVAIAYPTLAWSLHDCLRKLDRLSDEMANHILGKH